MAFLFILAVRQVVNAVLILDLEITQPVSHHYASYIGMAENLAGWLLPPIERPPWAYPRFLVMGVAWAPTIPLEMPLATAHLG